MSQRDIPTSRFWPVTRIALLDRKGAMLWSSPWSKHALQTPPNAPIAVEWHNEADSTTLSVIAIDIPAGAHTLALEQRLPTTADERIFCNGYQTWTESQVYHPNAIVPDLRPVAWPIWGLFQMQQYGDYHFAVYTGEPGQLNSYTYTYVRTPDDRIKLWGSLDESQGLTTFHFNTQRARLTIHKELTEGQSGDVIWKGWAGEGELLPAFDGYFEAQGRPFSPRKPVSGWTSWYHYYTAIDERTLRTQVDAFRKAKLPIDVFQIDDGWQQAVGDWQANDKFPQGMGALAKDIHAAGMQAGLWLAPFICEKRSTLAQQHPDWLAKDEQGEPVKAGLSLDWKGVFYALNWRHPEVQKYLRQVFAQVFDEWGFDLVKLDFLYAVAIQPETNRGREMTEAMAWLREVLGDKQMLACGVLLGPSFGQTDFCRIGSDIALQWEDRLLADVIRYRERVSTLNSLRSTIGRAALSERAFGNDPDVFLLRSEHNELTATQQKTLYQINLALGSLLFTSDPISEYTDAQMALYRKQFPHAAKRLIAQRDDEDRGWIEQDIAGQHYLLVYNLTAHSAIVDIPPGLFFDVDGSAQETCYLKPHDSRILRKHSEKPTVQLLASDGHVFPGLDCETLSWQDDRHIRLKRHPQSTEKAQVIIRIPSDWPDVWLNGTKVSTTAWAGHHVIISTISTRGEDD